MTIMYCPILLSYHSMALATKNPNTQKHIDMQRQRRPIGKIYLLGDEDDRTDALAWLALQTVRTTALCGAGWTGRTPRTRSL